MEYEGDDAPTNKVFSQYGESPPYWKTRTESGGIMDRQKRHKHAVWIYDDLWARLGDRYAPDGQKRPPHTAINMLLATGLSVMMGVTCSVNEETGEYHVQSEVGNE